MIHICTSSIGEFGIGNECFVSDEDVELMCCQNGSHPAGDMPAMVCLVLG